MVNGDKYEGGYQNGKKAGHGTYTWSNGGRYVGEFRDNLRSGFGTETSGDGTQSKSGEWVDDVFQGR
jgi:hypothetical protein